MDVKKKYCSGCELEQYIWKSHEGNKYCKNCWGKIKSKDPDHKVIPKVSAKRKKLDAQYLKLRNRFLTDIPVCEIKMSECSYNATEVHHTYPGANRETFYLVQSTWKAVCRNCHNWIHSNVNNAKELGYLK